MKYSVIVIANTFLFIIISACNFNLAQTPPTPTQTPTLVIPDTLTPTITFTPTITLTPSETPTLFFEPTLTPTARWLTCPGVVVTQIQQGASYTLHILRCEDGFEYDFGPFSKGVFAVGPNDKFIIYITIVGAIYGARIGDQYPRILADLKREKYYTTLNKNLDPKFEIAFIGENPVYKLILRERRYTQRNSYQIPVWMAQ